MEKQAIAIETKDGKQTVRAYVTMSGNFAIHSQYKGDGATISHKETGKAVKHFNSLLNAYNWYTDNCIELESAVQLPFDPDNSQSLGMQELHKTVISRPERHIPTHYDLERSGVENDENDQREILDLYLDPGMPNKIRDLLRDLQDARSCLEGIQEDLKNRELMDQESAEEYAQECYTYSDYFSKDMIQDTINDFVRYVWNPFEHSDDIDLDGTTYYLIKKDDFEDLETQFHSNEYFGQYE